MKYLLWVERRHIPKQLVMIFFYEKYKLHTYVFFKIKKLEVVLLITMTEISIKIWTFSIIIMSFERSLLFYIVYEHHLRVSMYFYYHVINCWYNLLQVTIEPIKSVTFDTPLTFLTNVKGRSSRYFIPVRLGDGLQG